MKAKGSLFFGVLCGFNIYTALFYPSQIFLPSWAVGIFFVLNLIGSIGNWFIFFKENKILPRLFFWLKHHKLIEVDN